MIQTSCGNYCIVTISYMVISFGGTTVILNYTRVQSNLTQTEYLTDSKRVAYSGSQTGHIDSISIVHSHVLTQFLFSNNGKTTMFWPTRTHFKTSTNWKLFSWVALINQRNQNKMKCKKLNLATMANIGPPLQTNKRLNTYMTTEDTSL